jgi:hypothetical protein
MTTRNRYEFVPSVELMNDTNYLQKLPMDIFKFNVISFLYLNDILEFIKTSKWFKNCLYPMLPDQDTRDYILKINRYLFAQKTLSIVENNMRVYTELKTRKLKCKINCYRLFGCIIVPILAFAPAILFLVLLVLSYIATSNEYKNLTNQIDTDFNDLFAHNCLPLTEYDTLMTSGAYCKADKYNDLKIKIACESTAPLCNVTACIMELNLCMDLHDNQKFSWLRTLYYLLIIGLGVLGVFLVVNITNYIDNMEYNLNRGEYTTNLGKDNIKKITNKELADKLITLYNRTEYDGVHWQLTHADTIISQPCPICKKIIKALGIQYTNNWFADLKSDYLSNYRFIKE